MNAQETNPMARKEGRSLPKEPRMKGPIDIFVTLKANPNKGGGKEINNVVKKEAREKVVGK